MSISLTIPNDPACIAAASAFFNALQGASRTAAPAGFTVGAPEWAPDEADDELPEGQAGAGVVVSGTGSAKLDTRGVPYHADYCANAADPFYGSGKRQGQWKKRKGVSDEAYDAWYEERLLDLAPKGTVKETGEDDHAGGVANAAAAFGAGGAAAKQTTGAAAAPKTAGEFMAWVSEQQAAGVLTQANIQAAYAMAGLAIADLFGSDVGLVARNVSTLYQILASQVGA